MIQFNHKIKLTISANPIILNINLAIVFIIILGHKILHEQLVSNKAKGESQNGGNKNTKHAKFSEKYVYVSGGKKRPLLGKFGTLYILVTSVLRFVLLPYYRRTHRDQYFTVASANLIFEYSFHISRG